jgi:hypothetical protein
MPCGVESVCQRDVVLVYHLYKRGRQYCLYVRLKRLGLIPNDRMTLIAHIDNSVCSLPRKLDGVESPVLCSLDKDASEFVHAYPRVR